MKRCSEGEEAPKRTKTKVHHRLAIDDFMEALENLPSDHLHALGHKIKQVLKDRCARLAAGLVNFCSFWRDEKRQAEEGASSHINTIKISLKRSG